MLTNAAARDEYAVPLLALTRKDHFQASSGMEPAVPYTTYKTSTGDLSLQQLPVEHCVWASRKRVLAIGLIGGVLLGLLAGLLIGFLVSSSGSSKDSGGSSSSTAAPAVVPGPNFTKSFDIADLQDAITMINGTKMANFIRDYFKDQLLLPASNGSRSEALRLKSVWLSLGAVASNVSKMVLISRPGQASSVTIVNRTWTSSYGLCRDSSNFTNDSVVSLTAASVAYTPAGKVTGMLVFVNYGRPEDFVNVSQSDFSNHSRIAIMRLGEINVNNKLKNAATWGASAVILYSYDESELDPCTAAYANAKWIHGDPATPSIGILSDTTYSIDIADASSQYGGGLPAVTVSAAAAALLLTPLSSASGAAASWRTLGQAVSASSNNSYQVTIDSGSTLMREEMGMVFSAIQGTIEPDRMIFVGAHHDALDKRTSQDAGSGAAIQDELLRILSKKKAAGWKPRRSIVFGSFDATALQIGSREWTESNAYEFQTRGVAFLQLGASVTGTDFVAEGSVGLNKLLVDATRNISAAEGQQQSLFDGWRSLHDASASSYPILAGRGDHSSFTAFLGIPTIQMKFANNSEKMWPQSVSCCRKQLDSSVAAPQRLSKLTEAYLSVLLRLSDSAILPYDPAEIADAIVRGLTDLKTAADRLTDKNISLAGIRAGSVITLAKLRDLSAMVNNASKISNRFSDIKVRRISDLVLTLTRVFLHPTGVPMIRDDQVIPNINSRNMLIGPLSYDENSMTAFPGVFDLLSRATRTEHWQALRRHVAELTLAMDGAVSYMTRGLADNSVWNPDF